MAGEDIPRLFTVHRVSLGIDHATSIAAGVVRTDIVAHGVQWVDGSVNVSWIADNASSAKRWWQNLGELGDYLGSGMTVVWLRQDLYADQAVSTEG